MKIQHNKDNLSFDGLYGSKDNIYSNKEEYLNIEQNIEQDIEDEWNLDGII